MNKDATYLEVLSTSIKTNYPRIRDGRENEVQLAAEEFKELGVEPDMHVGNEELKNLSGDSKTWTDPQKILLLEWFAGALVAINDKQAWFAVNSWINMAFTYEEQGIF